MDGLMDRRFLCGAMLVAGMFACAAWAKAPATDGAELFRTRVAPLLRQRCLDCHGGRKTKAGFDVRVLDSWLRGNRHGPVVQPGNVAGSRVVAMVERTHGPEMPPRQALSQGEVQDLVRWIQLGAPFDANQVNTAVR